MGTQRYPEDNLLVAESTSFDSLLAGERSRLVAFCVRLSGNPAVGEDLAQETLLEAWRHREKLRMSDRVSPEKRMKWLQAVARNVCLRWRRSHRRDLAHLAQARLPTTASDGDHALTLDELPSGDLSLELELERDELALLLDHALALLPPTARAVLIERYIHESPRHDIAERLNLTEDALAQRLYRAKLALRRVMENELNTEASAYGLVDPRRADEDGPIVQETRIWCPMCNKHRLSKYYDPSNNFTGFTCPTCWDLVSLPQSQVRVGLRSPKSVLNRQLAHIGECYWQAINGSASNCPACGRPAIVRIVAPHDIPEAFSAIHGRRPSHGLYVRCDYCKHESLNLLPHLTIDVPEAQQFWRAHPRMHWLPENAIDYAGQPALRCGFQSASDVARLDIVYQRETLRILGIHKMAC